MSTATSTLAVLASAGLVLAVSPERKLRVTPASKITPELRVLLTTYRDDLVRWLTTEPSNDNAKPPPPAPEPDPSDWRALHREYERHARSCVTCVAAGRGYGLRCGTGAATWLAYQGAG
jgi:hypothetical protein